MQLSKALKYLYLLNQLKMLKLNQLLALLLHRLIASFNIVIHS